MQKALANHGPAAADKIGQLDGIAGAFENAHGGAADVRLVVGGEAIGQEQDAAAPARRGVRRVPSEPTAEVAAMQRRQTTTAIDARRFLQQPAERTPRLQKIDQRSQRRAETI